LAALVRIAASTVCLLTLAAYLGQAGWAFDLCSHFRLQYMIALAICAGALVLMRDWRFVAIAGACLIVNAVEIVPWYFGADTAADEDSARLTLLCANVWNVNDDHERFLSLIEKRDPDVIVVLEATAAWTKALEAIEAEYPHNLMEVHEHPFGIALYSRLPLEAARIVRYGSADVPSIVARVELGGEAVTILATHPLPPRRLEYWRLRNEQLAAIAAARDELGDRVVVAGDFNASPFSPCMQQFVASMRSQEVRLRYASRGWGYKPTWPTFNRLLFTALDHILVTDTLAVTDFRTGPHIGSDHLPLQATIALGD
jgi:endonuclease/exonuclease/phosphatase (EEP) superfamily protein YafD